MMLKISVVDRRPAAVCSVLLSAGRVICGRRHPEGDYRQLCAQYYAANQEDTVTRATAEETMQKALNLMQQFSPRLLEQYKTNPE